MNYIFNAAIKKMIRHVEGHKSKLIKAPRGLNLDNLNYEINNENIIDHRIRYISMSSYSHEYITGRVSK